MTFYIAPCPVKNGEKYNHLKVIGDPFYKKHRTQNVSYVPCQCDCGNKKVYAATYVKSGKVKACGTRCKCHTEDWYNKNPLKDKEWLVKPGQKFGRWKVIGEPFYKFFKKGSVYRTQVVKCKCKCGKEDIKKCRDLINKVIKSCGCISKDNIQKFIRKGTLAKNGKKKCSKCLKIKLTSKFSKRKEKGDGFSSQCLRCYKIARIKRDYNMSIEEYERLLKKQKYKCACCNKKGTKFCINVEYKKSFCVDHNHKTGQIRGLLCCRCNLGIGHFDDSIKKLELAIRYLRKSRNVASKRQE